MIVARWSIDARFGHKQTVVDSMLKWQREIGASIGWTEVRLLTGSVGAHESTIQSEVVLQDLAALSASWDKLSNHAAHKAWSKELEPFVVSGTPRWEIFRVLHEDA